MTETQDVKASYRFPFIELQRGSVHLYIGRLNYGMNLRMILRIFLISKLLRF